MRGRFQGTTTIDRPVAQVFAFLAEGTNDPKFSPRVLHIDKRTEGPVAPGTVFASTVKDAGFTTRREFELTRVDPPSTIRWREISKNMVTAPEGGYDLSEQGGATRLTVFNELEGNGLGGVLARLALNAARKDADAFAGRIKTAVESSLPPA